MKAWAILGSNGRIFYTDYSPHSACIGKLEIFRTREGAIKATGMEPTEVRVVIPRKKKPNGQ